MFDQLFQLTDAYIFFLLAFITVFVSVAGVFLTRRFISLELRYKSNVVIGTTCALISVIYGVLTGITALYLNNTNGYATDAIQSEANAAAGLYRDSALLSSPVKEQVQTNVIKYLNQVIYVDWPLMEKGKTVTFDGDVTINAMVVDLRNHLKTIENNEAIVTRDMLNELKELYDARHHRISMSYDELNPEIWEVVFIGTVLTLFVNYLFGMNFYMHLFVVVTVAIMIAAMIFLLVTLDRPFQGEFALSPDSFQSLLTFLETKPPG